MASLVAVVRLRVLNTQHLPVLALTRRVCLLFFAERDVAKKYLYALNRETGELAQYARGADGAL